MSRPNIAVVCGGYSDEYVISMQSAQTFLSHLDDSKYRVFQAILSKEGWKVLDREGKQWDFIASDFSVRSGEEHLHFDGVINAIHGTPGEDGLIQGYFDLLGIPYNGSDVLSSSLTFNKGFCNSYLKQRNILVADSVMLNRIEEADEEDILYHLGLPCFVKPNDGGSSLGVTKVKKKEDLMPAIREAFSVGRRVLIESFVEGTEITCGVVEYDGEVRPVAITEIVFAGEFFDYEAKYNDSKTQEITPARIDEAYYSHAMSVSAEIYDLLGCKGFFRADYILSKGELYLIEVNTVPGMSERSLLPQQLEYAGIDLSKVLDEQVARMLSSR